MTDIYAPNFSNESHGTNFKKPKGTVQVERADVKAQRKADERREMEAAKARDRRLRGGCAWPDCPHKRMTLHAAHLKHRGQGGNPSGDRTLRHLLVGFCAVDHGRFDRNEIDIQPQTPQGTDGCCDFFNRVGTAPNGDPIFELYRAERLVGVPETRGA